MKFRGSLKMTQCADRAEMCVFPERVYHHDPMVVIGTAQILKLQSLLADLCTRCTQEHGWDDLEYFFSLPFARNKTPLLILFTTQRSLTVENLSASNLVAAVLVHEYRLWGWRTHIYLTDDFSARRSVIAPDSLRAEVVRVASRVLFERGAAISFISYQRSRTSEDEQAKNLSAPEGIDLRCVCQQREISSFLPLKDTFEATLATLGKRTRSHMRYYRRRAERELGCGFAGEVQIGKESFLRFNRECSFSTTDDLAEIRYASLANSPNTFLSGIHDHDGRWLSLVGGYKKDGTVEIYWQMNLASLPSYSLSTVMRSFLVEAEIAQGAKKLFIEGGTPHPMQSSFVRQDVTDFIVKRTNSYARFAEAAARSRLLKQNFLAQLLTDKELRWQAW
jgi:hypothetical protein